VDSCLKSSRRGSTTIFVEISPSDRRGVVSAHPMHACSRVRITRAEVHARNRGSVTEVGEYRAKQQLTVPGIRASSDVAGNEVRVLSFQVGRRLDVAGQDRLTKARRELFDPRLDQIRVAFALSVPPARGL